MTSQACFMTRRSDTVRQSPSCQLAGNRFLPLTLARFISHPHSLLQYYSFLQGSQEYRDAVDDEVAVSFSPLVHDTLPPSLSPFRFGFPFPLVFHLNAFEGELQEGDSD